ADIAERGQRVVIAIDQRAAEMAAARYMDLLDRCGAGGPCMYCFEQLAAAIGQRDRAWIARALRCAAGIDDDDALRRHAVLDERGGQRQADGAGAADRDVVIAAHGYCRISASISATVLGAAALRMCTPFSVTSASSSIRMPIFQYCSGTPS